MGRRLTFIQYLRVWIIGVGPEHSFWRDSGRVDYTSVTDAAALDAFDMVVNSKGVLPA